MEHTKNINKAINYIIAHLNRQITIAELADVAGMSPFHFHRVFREQEKETVAKFITRKRMEKAGRKLQRNNDPVSNIAYATGYGSVAVFCRNFKAHFGINATEYRQQNSKNNQSESKNKNNVSVLTNYLCPRKTTKIGDITMNCTFEIKNLEAKKVVYYRHVGAYDQMGTSINKLMQWAYPRGLVKNPPLVGAIYQDDPQITPVEKLHSDVFLVVDEDVKVDGEIGKHLIDGGMYAVGRFEIAISEFAGAWESMCGLIVEYGCQSIDGFYHELYLNNPDSHPEKKHIVEICIPVKPL